MAQPLVAVHLERDGARIALSYRQRTGDDAGRSGGLELSRPGARALAAQLRELAADEDEGGEAEAVYTGRAL